MVVGWLVLTLVGGATAGLTTSRLAKTFTLPDHASYETDARILALYHGDGGGQDPTIPILTAPARSEVATAGALSVLRRVSAAASLGGRYRVLGWSSTRDPRFLTADHRSTFLLVFTPVGFGSPDPTPMITAAVRAALPPGWSELTSGSSQLQSSTGQSGGLGVFAEAVLGGLGALMVLAIVFGSALAVLPLLGALVAIPTTFLLLLGLTTLTSINFVVQFLIGLVGLGSRSTTRC